MEKKVLERNEIIKFLKDMELGTERTIMAIDGEEDSVMPDLAMGVIKDKYFDSDTPTYLVGVYGNDYLFQSFFVNDYDDEDSCINAIIDYLEQTAIGMCGGNYGGLYIKPTDEEQQEFYEENKYNGEVARTIETFDYGDVDLVSRYDIDEGVTFYDCYQKNGGGYLGEFWTGKGYDLDQFSDEEIEEYLEENMKIGF